MGTREYYEDGRMIPMKGDKVHCAGVGLFGMPCTIEGICKGKTVEVTSSGCRARRARLGANWSVEGDPAFARIMAERESARIAKENQRKAQEGLHCLAHELGRAAFTKTMIEAGWKQADETIKRGMKVAYPCDARSLEEGEYLGELDPVNLPGEHFYRPTEKHGRYRGELTMGPLRAWLCRA